MMMMMGVALAGGARLVDGEPEFQNCLSDPDCTERFYEFLGTSMSEQGFAMQAHATLGSALVEHEGWTLGAGISTFPFGAPVENLSGKPENTQFSPVFPRIRGSWSSGDRAVGMTFLPPIPVQGASAMALSLDGSQALSFGETRLTVQGEWSFVRARAPVVASEEQFNNRDSFDNPAILMPDTYNAVCVPAGGCVDTYRNGALTVRGLFSRSVGPATPYLGLGGGYSGQYLWVMYDDTTWRLDTWQLTGHAGTALSFGRVQLLGGATAGPIPPALGGDDLLFWKLEGAAGITI